MSDKTTLRDLDDQLRCLVKWERFALYLPGIEQSHIEMIATEKHNVVDQKLLLFGKWLSLHPNATWQDVVVALKKADELKIAEELKMKFPLAQMPHSPKQPVDHPTKGEVKVTKDVVQELDKLNTSFQTLTGESEKAIEDGECSLDEIVKHTKQQRAYKITGLQSIQSVPQFFDVIEPHYNFLDCYLLVNLVLSLLPSLSQSAGNYKREVERFKKTTKVESLHNTLKLFFNESMSVDHAEVTVLLQNVWGRCNVWLVEVLIQTLFCLNSPVECKWFRVLPGSLCIILLAHKEKLQTLIDNSKQRIQFMKLMGVINLQIGMTSFPICEENDEYTFERSLLKGTEDGNTEAVQFLIEQLHVNVDEQCDEEPTAELNKKADTWHPTATGNFVFKRDACSTALMIACCNNDVTMTKMLLENGADPNIQSNLGFTALIYASYYGNVKLISMLLEHHADINLKKYSSGSSALHVASFDGNAKVVKLLLEQKQTDPNIQKNEGATPLYIASQNGHLEVVERLLKEKVNPNTPRETGVTPLFIASQNGHLQVVERLLKEKANPNIPRYTGATPLYIASQNGHLEVVERLLKEKANPNTPHETGVTPLFIASQNGHLEVVERLLKEKANPNIPCYTGATPLYTASQNGHLQVVERLLKEKVNPNTPHETGATPLYTASQNGHLQVVERLFKEKVNPNTPCHTGETPLYIASQNGHLQVVERLLKEKANPNTPCDTGVTPLYIASQLGHLEVVERLLEEKANPHTPHIDTTTPLFIASQNGHLTVVIRLLEVGVNPNTHREDGTTPLMVASYHDHFEVVQLLLINGADPNAKCLSGETASSFSLKRGHRSIHQMFEEQMEV